MLINTEDRTVERSGKVNGPAEMCGDYKDMKSTAATTGCLLYTSPSPRDKRQSRMPSSA